MVILSIIFLLAVLFISLLAIWSVNRVHRIYEKEVQYAIKGLAEDMNKLNETLEELLEEEKK